MNAVRLILFLIGGAAVIVGGAYVAGALDPYLAGKKEIEVAVPATPPAAPEPVASQRASDERTDRVRQDMAAAPAGQQVGQRNEDGSDSAVVRPGQGQAGSAAPDGPGGAGASDAASSPSEGAPSFDVVRLESDGSLVVAGRASPGSSVEIVTGSRVIGTDRATGQGDFVIVLDERLSPGDYSLVLRATAPDGTAMASAQTAVVSVPDTPQGQVLALVEEPGTASRLITVPDAAGAGQGGAQGAATTSQSGARESASGPAAGAGSEGAASPAAPPAKPSVAVEAVEIEGRRIFVAGSAEAQRRVRIYANEYLLGDAEVSPGGRFLVEGERDLPVGDYIIRADVLGTDGTSVIARAAVPFTRSPGEQISAVAPRQPAGAASQNEFRVRAAPSAGRDLRAGPPSSIGDRLEAAAGDAAAPAGTNAATGAASAGEGSPGEQAASSQMSRETANAGRQDGSDATAPRLEPAASSVIIRRGDTLWQISRRVYGRGLRYATIYLANQDQISDPDRIWPGQVFAVPGETDQGEPADLTGIEGQIQRN